MYAYKFIKNILRELSNRVLLKYLNKAVCRHKRRKMRKKGDEKFFTILAKHGNIKSILKLQF